MRQVTLMSERMLTENEAEKERLTNEIEAIRLKMVASHKPLNFDPDNSENCVISLERNFANLVAALQQSGLAAPEQITVFDFYARIEFLKKKEKPRQ